MRERTEMSFDEFSSLANASRLPLSAAQLRELHVAFGFVEALRANVSRTRKTADAKVPFVLRPAT